MLIERSVQCQTALHPECSRSPLTPECVSCVRADLYKECFYLCSSMTISEKRHHPRNRTPMSQTSFPQGP